MNKTPFCNMCFKAGKPASEYKAHWLRDKPGKGGVVVCPYLLSIECRYCHEKGHTMGQCPILKKRKDPRQKYDVSGLPPMPTKRMDPRQKYDVSGLPPMPSKLRPLVMPVSGVEAITETLVAARSVWMGVKLADFETNSQDDLSEDECDMTIAVMRQGENDTKRKFNWADLCDSDVEDDEF